MNWLSRFQKMVNELNQHPQVVVLDFQTFPPIEISQVNFLEKKYNLVIPKSVFDFYGKTNGLQLRWHFENNEQVFSQKKEKLEWEFFKKSFRWEDGGIMILPLELALKKNEFDAFSQEFNNIFTKEDFQVSISEDDIFSNDFFTTDFESYLEFLIAGKGLVSRRSFFYKKPETYLLKNKKQITTLQSFWTTQKKLNLNQALLKDKFPFCDQVRFSESQINRTTLEMIAKNGEHLSQNTLLETVEKHHEFLLAGGVGGEWTVLEIRGIVTAFYNHPKEIEEGVQANFERKNLSKNSFENIELPYSNFCAAFAEDVNFSKSVFEKSIFTDSFLQGADFCNSNLKGVDFSRSDLRNANFQNANLTNVDFENCDLRGTNFEGARGMDRATFVGTLGLG